jgi:membrane protein DedA with SNARE-associated domain
VPAFRALILQHGYLFLFCYILAVQAGVPVPADPVLLIMGASIGFGHYSFGIALLCGVGAALLGDLLWFELGRLKGRSILSLLCKFALEPDTCVRKTEVEFMRRGAWTFLLTKFVPGMSLISTPLAGAMRMPRWKFLLADAAGSTLWCSAYLAVGALFRKQIDELILALGLFGRRASLVIAILLSAYIGWRYLQRLRFRRQLRINRVSAAEAYILMSTGTPVTMVDLRSIAEIERTKLKIKGAKIMRPAQLRAHFDEWPKDQEVILYCT